jgi:hypothetical protein
MTRKKTTRKKTTRTSRQAPFYHMYLSTIVKPHILLAVADLREARQPLTITNLTKRLQEGCSERVLTSRVNQWLKHLDLSVQDLPYLLAPDRPEPPKSNRNPWPPPKNKPEAPLQPLQKPARMSEAEDARRAEALERQSIPADVVASLNANVPNAPPIQIPMPGGVGIMGDLTNGGGL